MDSLEKPKDEDIIPGAVDTHKILSLVFGDNTELLDRLDSNELLNLYNVDTKQMLKDLKTTVNNEVARLEREGKPISQLLLSAAINLNARDDI